MKKQLITAMLILSTLTFAGGNIEPVQVQIEVPEEVSTEKSSNFYLGLGISNLKLENDFTNESFKTKAITLQAGYAYNNYLAIETRYIHHIGDVEYDHGSDHRVNAGLDIKDYPTDLTNIAVFLKPQYKVNDFSLYALLGYGEVKLTNIPLGGVDRAEDGFQWGLGLTYDVTEHISMYVDYLSMYDDKGFNYRATNQDIKVDAFTLGVTYTF